MTTFAVFMKTPSTMDIYKVRKTKVAEIVSKP
jgi:hypothetical protein